MSKRARIFGGLLSAVLLSGCSRFGPDQNLGRQVSEREIVGTWRLVPESLSIVKRDAGYSPTDAARPHEIVFRADGTCRFRSIDEWGPARVEYLDTEGTWKLVHYSPFGGETKANEIQIAIAVRGVNFNLAEEKHRLHLWQYWGDPDEWLFLDYEKS